MAESPWLTIIGLGEDGPDGLCTASRAALEAAEIIIGPPRHLSLISTDATVITWPVPFADGIDEVMKLRGKPVVMLASGDPFRFGAGSVITKLLSKEEWRAFPGRSTFSLAASRLGWPLEKTICLGLHAAPLTRLRPYLAPDVRIIVLLRDGEGPGELARYLTEAGFGTSALTVMEALGGPRERITEARAEGFSGTFAAPVCAAVEIIGEGETIPRTAGLPDALFASDGVMTKRPVRALTLSALAPRPFEHLWDIGGGSGTIGIEWLLSDPTTEATIIEPRADRIALIRANAHALGVDRLKIIQGKAPEAFQGLAAPDAIFIGGGLSAEMLAALEPFKTARIVANAVTLESEALLIDAHARRGGELMRIDISRATPLGKGRSWSQAYPVTQWSYP